MAINNFNVGVGTTSQLTRYRYVATGGETSISGADADGKTLSYTTGLEQVFLNGVNLVRGQDYTATNGTSIGNLTALVVGDSLEVFAYVPFNIANAVTASTVDAKGDLLVGTANDIVGRLAVGSTNGQLLSVDSSTATGLAWRNPGLTLISTTSFSGASSQNLTSFITSTYDKYHIQIDCVASASAQMYFRFRSTTTDKATEYYGAGFQTTFGGTTGSVQTRNNGTEGYMGAINTTSSFIEADIFKFDGSRGMLKGLSFDQSAAATYYFGYSNNNIGGSFDGITIFPSTGTMTGKISIFGWNK